MLSYLAFLHHGIESTGDSPLSDGKELAQSCIKQLEALGDPDQFPPRLLILLVSPAYLDSLKSEQLLNGVLQAFDDSGHTGVELMGCSVAAVFFKQRIYPEGALLICLASRLLKVKVKASPDISHDPKTAVTSLLRKLNLLTERGDETHSFANRTLLALFPGFGGNKYLAPELHELLRTQLRARISIFGGVASANDPQRIRSGVLFANRKVYRKAIIAANIECGAPFGISLAQGLTETGDTYNVAELDPQDRRVIRRFREGEASEVMKRLGEISPVPLLANLSLDRDPTVDMPTLEGKMMRLTREVREGEPFHHMIPEPEKMLLNFRCRVEQSLKRAWLEYPIAGLGFRCAGLLRHREQFGLDLEYESRLIESVLSIRDSPDEKPFVGGFVDGEAGVDKHGKSVLGNWSNATLVFGDELRFRTPVYRGFEKLADFAGMRMAETHQEAIDRLTQLVYDIGYPGAMLSLCVRDQERVTIIAQSASGSRYKKLLGVVNPYPIDGDDILSVVAKEREPQFIPDSRKEKCGSMKAASRNNIISQYILPLTDLNDEITAVLQIDLGDLSYDTKLYQTEMTVLCFLGQIVNNGLNRTVTWEETKLIRKLDQAMSACLSAETIKQGLQQYLEHALRAFGLRKGHIRIAKESEHLLSLVAGAGDYFEETRKKRREIDFAEISPTARAFRDEKIVVINDPEHNDEHLAMCNKWGRNEALSQRLREVGSYANVPFKSERGERGTINLVSSSAWFFTAFYESALRALGERVGFLLETLRRKEYESFLLAVSPQYSPISDLNSIGMVLTNATRKFAETLKAEIASLYLWDADRQRYILRAQHGWDKPEWVNAAYYTDKENWTGTTALAGTPHHIPDLRVYYNNNQASVRRYTAFAFGQVLSRAFTVEAIALRLSVAGNRLGVLTFYRRIKSGEESGFITTDTELLQQGADNLASLIYILQANRTERWRKDEHDRRQAVYDETIPVEGSKPFELRVCHQVLKSYRALKASFYQVKLSSKTPQFELRQSFRRNPLTGQIVKISTSLKEEELVKRTINANRYNQKEVLTERIELKNKEQRNPQRVALAQLVRRACIPLVSEKQLVGVLDLHWSFDYRQADLPAYQHGESHLRMLGEVVGSAYRREQAKDEVEKGKAKLDLSGKAVVITSAFVLQHQHELGKVVQKMLGLLGSLKDAVTSGTDEKRRRIVEDFSQHISQSSETLNRLFDVGGKVVNPANENISVKSLFRSALKKERLWCEEHKVKVQPLDIPDFLSVYVDPGLIEIVFINLLNNAIKSMKDQERRDMSISARENADGEAVIVIRDTGVGITPDVKEQNHKGFVSRNGHISVGIPISKMILGIYGGSLEHEPNAEGPGTETRITLPLNYME
jgi:signal transduction histidine kinase